MSVLRRCGSKEGGLGHLLVAVIYGKDKLLEIFSASVFIEPLRCNDAIKQLTPSNQLQDNVDMLRCLQHL